MVGSDIQVITLKNGDFLVFNENGLIKNLKNNFEATKIYHKNGGIKGMNIVGMAALGAGIDVSDNISIELAYDIIGLSKNASFEDASSLISVGIKISN